MGTWFEDSMPAAMPCPYPGCGHEARALSWQVDFGIGSVSVLIAIYRCNNPERRHESRTENGALRAVAGLPTPAEQRAAREAREARERAALLAYHTAHNHTLLSFDDAHMLHVAGDEHCRACCDGYPQRQPGCDGLVHGESYGDWDDGVDERCEDDLTVEQCPHGE